MKSNGRIGKDGKDSSIIVRFGRVARGGVV
jgi:hypothetical protein